MNILIISNSAPEYFRFFNGLAQRLSADGHRVEIAVDCPFTRDSNRVDTLGLPVHEFAAFWRDFNEDPELVFSSYADLPLNAALLTDFERAEAFSFGQDRDSSYYHQLQAALLRFFERLLISSHIDVVVYENVSNTFAHFAWLICQRLRRSYCGLIASRMPGRFAVVDDPYGEHKSFEQIVANIRNGLCEVAPDVQQLCADYITKLDQTVPDYMYFNKLDEVSLKNLYAKRSKLDRLKMAWKHRNDDHRLAFQVGNPLKLTWQNFLRSLRRRMRLSACNRMYEAPAEGERFLLYPLHFHPESSTALAAAAYLDEYEVIRNIAFNLPVGTTLYVKDHMSAFALPPLSFYRRLAALPNVRLISPFAATKRLIRDSVGVITLTSTVGYEALLLNRRVFLYGSVFYEFHPNVVKVEKPAELFQLLLKHLDAPLPVGSDYHRDFVAAYYLGTHAGILNFFLDDEHTQILLDDVYHRLLDIFSKRAQTAGRIT
jgi:hypothetical protein